MSRKFIKFGTDWCGGCRQLKPVVNQLRKEGVIVEEYNPEIDTEIREKYGVQNLPTMILVEEDGTEISRSTGRKAKEYYLNLLNN